MLAVAQGIRDLVGGEHVQQFLDVAPQSRGIPGMLRRLGLHDAIGKRQRKQHERAEGQHLERGENFAEPRVGGRRLICNCAANSSYIAPRSANWT